MKSKQVRQTFIDYFKKNGHTAVASSSLIPENDPTLLFTNAGMNQFKNTFLGIEKRDYTKAVSSQKCVRAGGKHNDLDNVGFTARHHTFFEMLGNFSFGDYFKKDAIHFAWELLTKEYQIPKDKLYVTVYTTDDEAADIWHKQEGVPRDRIFRFEKDNFWRMGDIGPCGPCTEIFYDHGAKAGKEADPFKGIAAGEDRFVEIWNLVFMQYDEQSPGKLVPLPKPSVDTGSGLERMVAAMQGEYNNYDTDLFAPLMETACKISGLEYVKDLDRLRSNQVLFDQVAAMRVLADHARSVGFLMTDGALPSNEGRGYVLRRILRRAIRFGRKISPDKSIFPQMVESFADSMGSVYPELLARKTHVLSTVKDEESRFLSTLDSGTEILHSELKKLKSKNVNVVPGDLVFKLYDTYGFPADLTEVMSQEQGFKIDHTAFENEMSLSKQKAKASWKSEGAVNVETYLTAWAQDSLKAAGTTEFVGYDCLSEKTKIVGLFDGAKAVEQLNDGQNGFLIVSKTPFYAEGGGQAGDSGTGFLIPAGNLSHNKPAFEILNTIKKSDVFIHEIRTQTTLTANQEIQLQVNTSVRKQSMAHHSATHLMHAALRTILGEQIAQAGSLVDSQKLRFDFTHNKQLTPQELQKVEDLVNQQISAALPVRTEIMTPQMAQSRGAIALFGEKYGDQVRVLTMGSFSCELCGGTHVQNTSEIRLFKIVSESGVSSGVRRIEALAGDAAFAFLNKNYLENSSARKTAGILESWETYLTSEPQLSKWIQARLDELKSLQKEIKRTQVQSLDFDKMAQSASMVHSKKHGEFKLLVQEAPFDDRDLLSDVTDRMKSKIPNSVVVMIGQGATPQPLIVAVSKELSSKIPAGGIIKSLTQKFGGKGGGRPDFAQGSLDAAQATAVQKFLNESFSAE